MAESHQALAPIQFEADEAFRALGRADFKDHVERGPGCAAMQRTLERADCARDPRDDVGSRRDDHARCKCGRVETVIADGVEVGFQRACPVG